MHQADVQAQEADARPRAEAEVDAQEEADDAPSDGIVTTEEELRGYAIVRGIVGTLISPERVTYRDTQSYFNVLFDDNVRKPICRLHLNRSKKYIGIFDADKGQTRVQIADVEEIKKFAEQLRDTVRRYLGEGGAKGA